MTVYSSGGPYENFNTSGQRYYQAPVTDPNSTGGVLGVWLGDDEEVEWSIGFVNGRQYVYGYTIKKAAHSVSQI